jgi:two-component system NarL family response regulator
LKGIPAETLILALRSVVAGASWWDEIATQTIRSRLEQTDQSSQFKQRAKEPINATYGLTQREQEVLALIVAGKSNPEIGKDLCITAGTVRVHVHAIFHKLGVRDHTQAVISALQNQLIN